MVMVRDNCKFLSMHVSCCSSGVYKARLISTLYVGCSMLLCTILKYKYTYIILSINHFGETIYS